MSPPAPWLFTWTQTWWQFEFPGGLGAPEPALPREGSGDYRRPASTVGPKSAGWRTSLDDPYHNPGKVRVPADHRMEGGEAAYAPVRNGLPADRSYRYRAPGWQRRVLKAGLDLTAIAAADARLEQAHRDRIHAQIAARAARTMSPGAA